MTELWTIVRDLFGAFTPAQRNAWRTWFAPVFPTDQDRDEQSLATSTEFGPFEPGELVTIGVTGKVHFHFTRKGGTAATTSRPSLPAGVWRGTVPHLPNAAEEGVYLQMIQATSASGWVKRSLDRGGTAR